MNEKAEVLFDAVTSIRPELVERALDAPIRRRPVWRRYAALCACLALAVCVGWFALLSGGMGGGSTNSSTIYVVTKKDKSMSNEEIAKVIGGNAIRVLREVWAN